jgi:putative tryptophan/tyrosine transport system substrate-binding protein
MKRREFIAAALGGVAVAWPHSARAQQSAAAPVVGLLASGLEARSPHLIGFSKGLSETGFAEGLNVGIQYRFAEGRYDRLPEMVTELVNRPVAVVQ